MQISEMILNERKSNHANKSKGKRGVRASSNMSKNVNENSVVVGLEILY